MNLKRIKQVEIEKDLSVYELITRMKEGCGFTGKRLGRALDILYDMYKDEECTVFLGLAH